MRARRTLGAAALLSVFMLAACGEKPQTSGMKKVDAKAHSGSTVSGYTAPGWEPGNKTSWEGQVRERNKGQNEYQR